MGVRIVGSQEVSYPKLMEHKAHIGFIVLFYNRCNGTVLAIDTEERHPVGAVITVNPDVYTEYEGPLTLENF